MCPFFCSKLIFEKKSCLQNLTILHFESFSPSIQFTTLIFSYNITTKYLLPMSSGKIYMKTEFSFFSTGSSIRYQRQTVICWQVRTIHSTNIEISRGTLNEKHLNFHGEIYNLITLFFSSNVNSINFAHLVTL